MTKKDKKGCLEEKMRSDNAARFIGWLLTASFNQSNKIKKNRDHATMLTSVLNAQIIQKVGFIVRYQLLGNHFYNRVFVFNCGKKIKTLRLIFIPSSEAITFLACNYHDCIIIIMRYR